MAKISVIGAGSWAIALALLLSKNGHQVNVWSIMEDEIKMLNESYMMNSSENWYNTIFLDN